MPIRRMKRRERPFDSRERQAIPDRRVFRHVIAVVIKNKLMPRHRQINRQREKRKQQANEARTRHVRLCYTFDPPKAFLIFNFANLPLFVWVLGLKVRNIRYSVERQRLKPQQICNKSATGMQHFGRVLWASRFRLLSDLRENFGQRPRKPSAPS